MAASLTTRIRSRPSCRAAEKRSTCGDRQAAPPQPGSPIVVHPELGRFQIGRFAPRKPAARRTSLAEAVGRAVGAAWVRTARHESAVLLLVVAPVHSRGCGRTDRSRAVRDILGRRRPMCDGGSAARDDVDALECGAPGLGDDACLGTAPRAVSVRAQYRGRVASGSEQFAMRRRRSGAEGKGAVRTCE